LPIADIAPGVRPIPGGVTAPSGFRCAGVACGIKASGLDLMLLSAEPGASAAGVFTTNRAKAAPVLVSMEHLARSGGRARAVAINSGCANACTAERGHEAARRMASATARAVGCADELVLIASTGVIGVHLPIDEVERGIARAAASLDAGRHLDAARAIMTTDPFPKEHAVEVVTPQGAFRVGGIAKGSGMIEPLLATMLAVVTTDAAVEPAVLRTCLADAVADTFNAITVDGECSTNDTVFVLASGGSGVDVRADGREWLTAGLRAVCRHLALEIVRGGEGATRTIEIRVTGAASEADARVAARALANSPLVKTAVHGGDPNWGRLVAAAGRSGAAFEIARAAVSIGPVVLFRDGRPFDERAREAAAYLASPQVSIEVNLGAGGSATATMWTCDLSAEYVRINSEYRS
jgi:glutamate N-acetyltransferase/amino-acid N-acetyltransferase